MSRLMLQEIPDVMDRDAGAQRLLRFQVAGDSMLPKYRPGMIVECKFLSVCEDTIYGELRIGSDYLVMPDGRAFFRRLVKIEGDVFHFGAINGREFPSVILVRQDQVMSIAVARAEYIPLDGCDLDVPKKEAASASSIDPSPASIGVNAGKTFAA